MTVPLVWWFIQGLYLWFWTTISEKRAKNWCQLIDQLIGQLKSKIFIANGPESMTVIDLFPFQFSTEPVPKNLSAIYRVTVLNKRTLTVNFGDLCIRFTCLWRWCQGVSNLDFVAYRRRFLWFRSLSENIDAFKQKWCSSHNLYYT